MGRFLKGGSAVGGSIRSHEGSGDGGIVKEQTLDVNELHPGTVPTSPSPISRKSDPFDIIDDVPSIYTDPDDIPSQVSQVDILRIPSDIPITMTPPLTPPTIITKADVEGYEGRERLFTRLGGYGWRG
jgi:hypothetical protein